MNKFLAITALLIFLIEEIRLTNFRDKAFILEIQLDKANADKERFKELYLKQNTKVKTANKVFDSGTFINLCYEIK